MRLTDLSTLRISLHQKTIIVFLNAINSICNTYNQQRTGIELLLELTMKKTSKQIEEQRKDRNGHFKGKGNMKVIKTYEKMLNLLSSKGKCKFIPRKIYFHIP